MAKHNEGAPRTKKSRIRFSGWNLFMKELSGSVWRGLAGKDRFRYASALWRPLSHAERDRYRARAKVLRDDAQRRLREKLSEDQWILAEDSGSAAAAQTVADRPGSEVPQTDPMWRPHSDHPSTPPSAYSVADTTSYDAGGPFPSYQNCITRWRLPSSASVDHVGAAMPPVAGSGSPPSPWPTSRNVYTPFPGPMVSPARYSDRSLSASTPATPAHSPMPGTDLFAIESIGRDCWAQPGTPSVSNGMRWSAVQGVDFADESRGALGQALSGADTSAVDFLDGDPYGGAAPAMAISPTYTLQDQLAAAEEWTALINSLPVADEGSARVLSPMSFTPEVLGRCSPASQAVIELLAGSLRHGSGESFYPTPAPSVGSPVQMADDAICELGCSELSAADASSRTEYCEDPPLTRRPSAFLARPYEGWSQSIKSGPYGGDSTAANAPFMTMTLEPEAASLASECHGATSTRT